MDVDMSFEFDEFSDFSELDKKLVDFNAQITELNFDSDWTAFDKFLLI